MLAQSPLTVNWLYAQIPTPTTLAFSPNGTFEVVGGQWGVQVYSASSGTLLQCLPFTAWSSANSVAFSPNSALLAVGGVGTSGVVEAWNVANWSLLGTFKTSAAAVNSVAFSADNATPADGGTSASGTGVVELWNVATQSLTSTLGTAATSVSSVAFSSDGVTLAVGGANSTGVVELWNTPTGKLKVSLATSSSAVASVAISPNGATVADGGTVGGNQGVLELWNITTGSSISSLAVGATGVESVCFSPDGTILADGGVTPKNSYTGDFELWNVATGAIQAQPPTDAYFSISAVAFAANGQSVSDVGVALTGTPVNGVLQSWDLNGNVLSTILTNPPNDVYSISLSPDSKTLAVAGAFGTALAGAGRRRSGQSVQQSKRRSTPQDGEDFCGGR